MSKQSHSPTHCTQCKGPTNNCAHNCPLDDRSIEEGAAICTCCSKCVEKCLDRANGDEVPGGIVI